MSEERLALSELLEKVGDGDFLRTVAEAVLQMLMEPDVEGLIGAGRYERNGERTTGRNGHRDRVLKRMPYGDDRDARIGHDPHAVSDPNPTGRRSLSVILCARHNRRGGAYYAE